MGQEIPERHRRVIRALASGGPEVPDTVYVPVARVEPVRRRARRTPALVAVAATILLATVVAVATTTGGAPAADEFAGIAERPATQPTPASDGVLLDRSFQGVSFPDWSGEFGWRPVGGRTDTIGGRRAETVFYTHDGHRIAYSVVDGDLLEPPDGATSLRAGSVTLYHFRDGARDIVMFERDGRTCVRGGDVISADTLVELASWQGRGAITF
jgi:hypothetical protein